MLFARRRSLYRQAVAVAVDAPVILLPLRVEMQGWSIPAGVWHESANCAGGTPPFPRLGNEAVAEAIGAGAFGSVYSAVNVNLDDLTVMAVKETDLRTVDVRRLLAQFRRHAHAVRGGENLPVRQVFHLEFIESIVLVGGFSNGCNAFIKENFGSLEQSRGL